MQFPKSGPLDGSPVDYIVPEDGVSFITEPAAIMATTEHADEARLFIDFLLSEDGQKLAASQGYLPILPGVAGPEGYPALEDMTLLGYDADEAVKTNEEVRAKFADIFGF